MTGSLLCTDRRSSPAFLVGGGEMGELMRRTIGRRTAAGRPNLASALHTVVRIMLTTRFAMCMGWGRALTFFYNDAYRPIPGAKHPRSMGQPAQ